MFGPFTDVMPRALLAGAALWAGASYFVTGPSIAARVARADHLPACERQHAAMTLAAAEERREALNAAPSDPSKALAADLLRAFGDLPIMQELGALGGGLMGRTTDAVVGQYERGARAAEEAYRRSAERLAAETASDLAAGGSVCGCAADAAIAETRTEWAIFSGTLSLISPSPVERFGDRISQISTSERCSVAKEVAR